MKQLQAKVNELQAQILELKKHFEKEEAVLQKYNRSQDMSNALAALHRIMMLAKVWRAHAEEMVCMTEEDSTRQATLQEVSDQIQAILVNHDLV